LLTAAAPPGWMRCRPRTDEVARRIDAQRAEFIASSEHAARIQQEAQAEPETGRQAETPHDM